MPCNPLRAEQLRILWGSSRVRQQRLVAKWLVEGRIAKDDLVSGLDAWGQHSALGAPEPPYGNGMGLWAMRVSEEGKVALAAWESEYEAWRRAYLTE